MSAVAQKNEALLPSDTLMPITDKTYTTHCCHFLSVYTHSGSSQSVNNAVLCEVIEKSLSTERSMVISKGMRSFFFPFLMWACVQCVDMLKQIAGDDRDTKHEFWLPTH